MTTEQIQHPALRFSVKSLFVLALLVSTLMALWVQGGGVGAFFFPFAVGMFFSIWCDKRMTLLARICYVAVCGGVLAISAIFDIYVACGVLVSVGIGWLVHLKIVTKQRASRVDIGKVIGFLVFGLVGIFG